MTARQPKLRAVRIDTAQANPTTWEDPARGTLSWVGLFSQGSTPTDSLTCGVAQISPGQHFAPHRHPQSEVYFGLEGRGEVVIDGVAHALAPGVALFIPGEAEHGVPGVEEPLRWFYCFAADSFDDIRYRFTHEAALAGAAPSPQDIP